MAEEPIESPPVAAKKRRWRISSGDILEVVYATDQFRAWDTLRDRCAAAFGMIAEAEADENGEPIPIRTSLLMLRWHRDQDARRFVKRMIRLEGVDTTAADLEACVRLNATYPPDLRTTTTKEASDDE